MKFRCGWPVRRVLSSRLRAMDGHSSGTHVAMRLLRSTRLAGRRPPAPLREAASPIRSCSRRGLPCRPRYRGRGELLPHRFTLAPSERGGFISVALSLGLPRPGVTRRLLSMLPGRSSPLARRGHPAIRAALLSGAATAVNCQSMMLCSGP